MAQYQTPSIIKSTRDNTAKGNNLADTLCTDEHSQAFEKQTTLSVWDTVQRARHPSRLKLENLIQLTFDTFIELHGDRQCSDDRALIGSFASIKGDKVMLIGNNKGCSTEENITRNFGYASPEGFRKAYRRCVIYEFAE